MKNPNIIAAMILGAAIVLAVVLHGFFNRYCSTEIAIGANRYPATLDRMTGTVEISVYRK